MDIKSLQKAPFNIDLIYLTSEDAKKLKEVKEISIFDNQNNFHPDGLFSTVIFGAVGTEIRKRTFGYINLKLEVLHPLIYYAITQLKGYYKDIISGKKLAIWDEKQKEFRVKFDPEEEKKAQTGYEFFFKHVTELKFERNNSDKRNFLINLYEKAIKENKYKMKYLLVLPAGLRDYTIDKSGKPQEDEINTYYRKILAQINLIDELYLNKNVALYDLVRYNIQEELLKLFEYLKSLLEGKHKLILGKWLTRKIFNSTRNVASSLVEKVNTPDDPNRLRYNEVFVGLHQFLRSLVPVSIYEIRNKYLSNIFIENSNYITLTNAKTLKKEEVLISHIQKDYDLWMTSDGLEKVIANFGNLSLRTLPITFNRDKHYLGLLYRDNQYFRFFQDIDEVPERFSKDNVKPITLAEFLYISVHHLSGKYPGFVTRYPITGYGSIYPAYIKLKTTSKFYTLKELNENWEENGVIAYNFPDIDYEFFNTQTPHPSHMPRLGLDFDGDTVSLIAVTTDEAIEEIKNLFNRKEYYIDVDGKFFFPIYMDSVNAILSYMSKF